MALPDPLPGLVFRYEYLWADEASTGARRETSQNCRPYLAVLTGYVGGSRRIGSASGGIRGRMLPGTPDLRRRLTLARLTSGSLTLATFSRGAGEGLVGAFPG